MYEAAQSDFNLATNSAILLEVEGLALLVHKVCKSQLIKIEGKPVFCEVCGRIAKPEEIEEVDDSPSPFSG